MAIKRADFPLPDVDDPLHRGVLRRRGARRARDPALRRVRPRGSGTRSRRARRAAATLDLDADERATAGCSRGPSCSGRSSRRSPRWSRSSPRSSRSRRHPRCGSSPTSSTPTRPTLARRPPARRHVPPAARSRRSRTASVVVPMFTAPPRVSRNEPGGDEHMYEWSDEHKMIRDAVRAVRGGRGPTAAGGARVRRHPAVRRDPQALQHVRHGRDGPRRLQEAHGRRGHAGHEGRRGGRGRGARVRRPGRLHAPPDHRAVPLLARARHRDGRQRRPRGRRRS